MRVFLALLFWACLSSCNASDDIYGPAQPRKGPGGSDYQHAKVRITDRAEGANGYWVFEPAKPTPDSADVVVMNHGWGAYNPASYGGWIRHIVRKGSIVIYTRYQYSMATLPRYFNQNAATAISNALELLKNGDHVYPLENRLVMAGHSFGGLITANLTILADSFQIPEPCAVMICQPGGIMGGRLDSYEAFPANIPLLMIVGADDNIASDRLARPLFQQAQSNRKNYIVHHPDKNADTEITASHGEILSVFDRYNSGHGNPVIWRARWASQTNAVDYFCYWKLFDALKACALADHYCNYAFGNTEEQRYMGQWSDGTPVKELTVLDTLE